MKKIIRPAIISLLVGFTTHAAFAGPLIKAGPAKPLHRHRTPAPQPAVVEAAGRTPVVLKGNLTAAEGRFQPRADALRDAYILLSRADHDYNGHRFAAMRQTAAAARLLGIVLRGDGHGVETQEVSDRQLREAATVLGRERQVLADGGQEAAAGHVTAAINQIDIALAIR